MVGYAISRADLVIRAPPKNLRQTPHPRVDPMGPHRSSSRRRSGVTVRAGAGLFSNWRNRLRREGRPSRRGVDRNYIINTDGRISGQWARISATLMRPAISGSSAG